MVFSKRPASYQPFLDRLHRTGKLCVVHIPKTGGSTLIDGLRRTLGDRAHALYGESGRETFAGLGPGSFPGPGPVVVSGHFQYGPFRDVLADDFAYLSFVRDPLERLVSYYRYSQVTPTDNFIARAARDHDFGGFLHYVDGRRRRIIRNQQTRALAPTSKQADAREVQFRRVKRGLHDDQILVAPTSRCDFLIPLICQALEVTITDGRSKVSDGASPVAPTEADRAFVAANNVEDQALYDHVCRRAEEWPTHPR
ncbi:MAG: sulfotransferase family 2 domain-containing protein [Acidimicrobiales bacterium]